MLRVSSGLGSPTVTIWKGRDSGTCQDREAEAWELLEMPLVLGPCRKTKEAGVCCPKVMAAATEVLTQEEELTHASMASSSLSFLPWGTQWMVLPTFSQDLSLSVTVLSRHPTEMWSSSPKCLLNQFSQPSPTITHPWEKPILEHTGAPFPAIRRKL